MLHCYIVTFLFSKEASEGARLDEKGWEKKKEKDKAVRRERTKQKDPLIQITNNLFVKTL